MNDEKRWITAVAAIAVLAAAPLGAADMQTGQAKQEQGSGYRSDKAGAGSTTEASDVSTTATSNSAEQQVLTDLHQANQKEIQLGQLATQKAQSTEVRDFGQHLVTDHTQADQRVTEIAASQSVQLSQAATQDAQSKSSMDKLQNTSATEFDKAFLRNIHKAHQDTIAKLEKAQGRLSSASPVQQLVKDMLPKLREHRDRAATLLKMASSKRSGSTPAGSMQHNAGQEQTTTQPATSH